MPKVCSYCGDPFGFTPCVPAMDGRESHGVCSACEPRAQAEIDAYFFAGASRDFAAEQGRAPSGGESFSGGVAPGTSQTTAAESLAVGNDGPLGTEPVTEINPPVGSATAGSPSAFDGAREYVALDEIAEVCGLRASAVHNRFRPDHWGVPKEWRFQGTVTLYLVAALPELADALAEAGLTGAAERLRTWWMARCGWPAQQSPAGRTPTSFVEPPAQPQPAAQPPPAAPWYQKGQFE
jgi:hypothetical protein